MEKPLLDNRSYRVIKLPNQLEILLIHDPDTDKAAASMDVNVGSFSDPDDLPGTAHAVEHLCFMGTEKYPEENEYSAYLAKFGGDSNAYTASTSTNYFFELSAGSKANHSNLPDGIKPQSSPDSGAKTPLYGALDRFAQFFIKPLFLADTLDRELRIVDSENKKNLQSDQWRLTQVGRSTSNRKHPVHKFATGNYQCLYEEPVSRGIDIRKRFIEFYEAHYSADRMKLVVLGRESLHELQAWASELFSAIPNKALGRLRWDNIPALDLEGHMTQVFIKPVMEQRRLNIDFTYRDEEAMFDSQPSRYLAHLIGNEGPGSILAYLKEEGLMDSLFAGSSIQCPGTSIFYIDTQLTKKGVQQYQRVLKTIFHYIAMLKENPPLAWISNEMSRLSEIDFKFKQKRTPSRTVSELAELMQNPFLPRNYLLSHSLVRRFDPVAIEQGLSYLRPDNFRFFLIDQEFPGDWNEKEKWYQTEYKLERIPPDLMQELWAAAEAPAADRPSSLHLPARNEFIPQNLEVEREDISEPSLHPILIRHSKNVRTWFKKDDQFWVPKVNIKILLRSPVSSLTPTNAIMTRLYVDLVEHSLTKYAYDANIAGLSYTICENAQGLVVEVSGFNDKIAVILEKILLGLRDLEFTHEQFYEAKERVRTAYQNFDYMDPYRQISAISRMLIYERSWPPFQMLEELPSIQHQHLRQHICQMLFQMHIETLVHGNVSPKNALDITTLVESIIHPYQFPEDQWPLRRVIMLPAGARQVYERPLKNPNNVNHCLEYNVLIDSVSDRLKRAKLLLFCQIAEEPCFNTLRTKEQLGYIVNSGASMYGPLGTWRILVQSEMDCAHLEGRCDAFLANLEEHLRTMTDHVFEEHKTGLINKSLEALPNLRQETSRFWTHITSEVFDFEQVYHDVENIRVVNKKDMVDFFTQHIHPASPTRTTVSIHLVARSHSTRQLAATQEKVAGANHTQMTDSSKESATTISSTNSPIKIVDVRAWKAGSPFSPLAKPVKNISEFEKCCQEQLDL